MIIGLVGLDDGIGVIGVFDAADEFDPGLLPHRIHIDFFGMEDMDEEHASFAIGAGQTILEEDKVLVIVRDQDIVDAVGQVGVREVFDIGVAAIVLAGLNAALLRLGVHGVGSETDGEEGEDGVGEGFVGDLLFFAGWRAGEASAVVIRVHKCLIFNVHVCLTA